MRKKSIKIKYYILQLGILSAMLTPINLYARPIVVELFTSQNCPSCPPADTFLKELTKIDDVIPLSLHVDYWDSESKGGWKDPYSNSENTKRQRKYNTKNFKTNRNYTPQMVIDGIFEEIGTKENEINLLILRAKKIAKNPWRNIPIKFIKKDDKYLEILIGENLDDSLKAKQDITLFAYTKITSTNVKRGVNSGKIMDSYNVVSKIYNLGEWKGSEKSIIIDLDKIIKTDKIAVIIQEKNFRNISGAETFSRNTM